MVWPSLSRDLENAYDVSKKKKKILETDIGKQIDTSQRSAEGSMDSQRTKDINTQGKRIVWQHLKRVGGGV